MEYINANNKIKPEIKVKNGLKIIKIVPLNNIMEINGNI